jgi:ATP-dependent DNA helicase RecQ
MFQNNDKQIAEYLLKTALMNPNASFRDGQWESIEQLIAGNRVLVVQHTGWGKSMVYFIATKILRIKKQLGPTLLISPLLSLMRNQIEAAKKFGLNAVSIDSYNEAEWDSIENDAKANLLDILLISPERLSNKRFEKVLPNIKKGLFVIDEAHCISDWGHDFRPDYKKIIQVIRLFPPHIPILATTATANNRVVADITKQIGSNIVVQRGSLARNSLILQNIQMPTQEARMAWLVKTIPTLKGSGIIYTLTQRDSEQLSKWLNTNNINAKAYHADLENFEKKMLEQELLKNQVKVLVATVALGMGFDKPDLTFVIHFQRPASVVHYYQQVGRAGRALNEAYGILLNGKEDDHIAKYFIETALPPQRHTNEILDGLKSSPHGLSTTDMQKKFNLKSNQITKVLQILSIKYPPPITKIDSKWYANFTSADWKQDSEEEINTLIDVRQKEQQQMQDYMKHSGCLMMFLQDALNDPNPQPCGRCTNCNSKNTLAIQYDFNVERNAESFLKRNYPIIKPRKQWPLKNMFQKYTSLNNDKKIPEILQAKEGKALTVWGDSGWGRMVKSGKYQTKSFDPQLVDACVNMIYDWFNKIQNKPRVIVYVPSLKRQDLVKNFAEQLSQKLGIDISHCIEKKIDTESQKTMQNSIQQLKNLDGVFQINLPIKYNVPCILVDDIVDSGWTMTVLSCLLRQNGFTDVYPLALALQISTTNEES